MARSSYYSVESLKNRFIYGEVMEELRKIPSNSIDCCVTSPPYYEARHYNIPGEIGWEDTQVEYIMKLIEVFREVKRILKPSGSIWVNIADKIFHKFTLNIPEGFIISMYKAGLCKVQTVIWEKPNSLPGGGTTRARFNINFEYFYHFVKSRDYYFNQLYEPYSDVTLREAMKEYKGKGVKDYESAGVQNPSDVKRRILQRVSKIKFGGNRAALYGHPKYSGNYWNPSDKGAIKRAVWRIPHNASKHIHLATFPVGLVRNALLATCPEGGIIIDPFMGAGNTAIAAYQNKRYFIGIDGSAEYCALAGERIDTEIAKFLFS